MNRAGRSAWAARTGILAVLLTAIVLVFEARDGFRSHAMLVFPGLLLIAVTLLDRASYVITAGIVLSAIAGLGIAERHGLTGATPGVRTSTSRGSIIYVDLTVLVFAVIGSRIARDAQRNVSDLRANINRLSATNRDLTDTAGALRASEAKGHARAAELQAVMDAAPAVILIAQDAECNRISGNRMAHVLLRQQPGSNLSMSAPEDEKPVNFRLLQNGVEIPPQELPVHRAALSGQAVPNWEMEVVFEEGDSVFLLGNAEPMLDNKGRPRGAVVVLSDITERKRTEDALRDSEERFRATFMNSADALLIVTLDEGTIIDVNDAFEELYGYTREEAIGKTTLQLHLYARPADRARALAEVRAKRQLRGFEAVARKKSGEEFNASLSTNGFMLGGKWHLAAAVRDITERKQAERALREHEQQLASIYNTVRDVIFQLAVEPEGQFRFASVNAAFLKVTGLSLEAVVGKTVNEVVPEPFLTMVLAKYRQAVEENTIVSWEETSDYPTGRLTGEVSVAPVFDNTGTCTHLVGSVHDITERKHAEAALRESEELLRTVADTVPAMIWMSGLDKRCTFVNKSWLDFVGHTMEQEMGTGWADGIHTDDLDRCLTTYSLSFDARRSFQIEYRLRRADGEYRSILDNGAPFYRGGKFAGYIGSGTDVTEQKAIEERLRSSETRLKDAQRLVKVGSWEREVDDSRAYWSDEMFRIYGLREDAPPKFPVLLSYVHAEDRQKLVEAHEHVQLSDAPVHFEFRIVRPDSEMRFARTIMEAVRNDRGAVVRTVGATQDVTDQKRAQEEAFARQKLESVGTLANGIAHDFNNLLAAVAVQAELALAELGANLSPKGELKTIRDVAMRGSEIVRQLMIYTGQESTVPDLVDIPQVIEDMLELLKFSVSKHAVLRTDFGGHLPAVRASAAQISQLVMNLATTQFTYRFEVAALTLRKVQDGSQHIPTVGNDVRRMGRVMSRHFLSNPRLDRSRFAFDVLYDPGALIGIGGGLCLVKQRSSHSVQETADNASRSTGT
jgi:PAS domain S-box-containing protein